MKVKTRIITILLGIILGIGQQVFAVDADIVVALDGSGDFSKIQDAIDAVPSNQTDRRTVIFIKNGLYNTEKLLIPSTKLNVTIIGESRDQTVLSYHIYDCSNPDHGNKCPSEDVDLWSGDVIRTSATLTIKGNGFRAENLTIQNTAGPVGQALAITVQADKVVFVNVDLKGYQDTIYLWDSGKRSYFENCLVLGRTDYIYGAGIAFFESCEIRSYGGGYITAPSTPRSQAYGYVFNNCDLTYTDGSPNPSDDGVMFALGRPWHEYPKVAWLNCNMTGMINPLGWPTTWNMDYAATSEDLHLYEYNNTGDGADMSGRANWVGIRALTDDEALEYTAAKVLNGNDGWAPYEEEPLVKSYDWDGGGANQSWLTAENWNPDGVPASAEVANAAGNITIDADGNTFAADLNLKDGATLKVTANSTAAYIAAENATISASTDVSLSGRIATKDVITISSGSKLTLSAELNGVHQITKTGTGSLILNADNSDFSGIFILNEGTLEANIDNVLGKAAVEVNSGCTLKVGSDAAFFPESSLKVVTGAKLELNANVTLSQFYINGTLQSVGTYNATTNSDIISGSGSIVVGRPSSFTFSGGTWDNVSGYTPALLPEAGETVYCQGEMETASTVNPADVIFVKSKGRLRLRGVHTSTGTLTFEGGSRISYATGGTGFTLEAPIIFTTDINLEMNSGNADGSTMVLKGTISGSDNIVVKNTKSGFSNTSKVSLEGDNSNFSGTWDVTTHASDASGVVGIVGVTASAYGTGTILVGKDNYAQFDHAECVTVSNSLYLATGAKAIVNADITLGSLVIEGTALPAGVYSATTHPEFIEGNGKVNVLATGVKEQRVNPVEIRYNENQLFFNRNIDHLKVFSVSGKLMYNLSVNGSSYAIDLKPGIYIAVADNFSPTKLVVNN